MTEAMELRLGLPRASLVAGLMIVTAIMLTACQAQSHARGANDPKTAATLFVGSINAGSSDGAAAISCTSFADAARSAARSGHDPGITFSLGTVTTDGDGATAVLIQSTNVGGSTQQSQRALTLRKSDDRWLVCGQS
jgi:hypothetical protein